MNTKTVFLYTLLLFGLFLFGLSSCKREINKESTGNVDFSGDLNPGVIAGDGSTTVDSPGDSGKTADSSGDSGKTVYSSGDGNKTGDSSGDGNTTGDSSGDGSTTVDSSGDSGKTGDNSGRISLKHPNFNDTGIIWGGNYPSGNNPGCTGDEIAHQDCSHGRDALAAAGKLTKIGAGEAGFDFTKLGKDGSELAVQNGTWSDSGNEASGTRWSCVKDNHTGLVWEVKTNDGSAPTGTNPTVSQDNIHHKDNTYRWGGMTALGRNHQNKEGIYNDDWNGLVNGTNSEKRCGFDDWRIPTIEELFSIVNRGKSNTVIDTGYFPNTSLTNYWSSSPYVNYSLDAWNLNFNYGYEMYGNRDGSARVRLVRFGP